MGSVPPFVIRKDDNYINEPIIAAPQVGEIQDNNEQTISESKYIHQIGSGPRVRQFLYGFGAI